MESGDPTVARLRIIQGLSDLIGSGSGRDNRLLQRVLMFILYSSGVRLLGLLSRPQSISWLSLLSNFRHGILSGIYRYISCFKLSEWV